MRSISTRMHGVFDYLIGAYLVLMPFVFGYATAIGGPETWLPIAAGLSIICYSLLTNYELGVIRRLDMRAHLWLDGITGFTLLISTVFVGSLDPTIWATHLSAGVLLLVAAFITDRQPQSRTRVETVPRPR